MTTQKMTDARPNALDFVALKHEPVTDTFYLESSTRLTIMTEELKADPNRAVLEALDEFENIIRAQMQKVRRNILLGLGTILKTPWEAETLEEYADAMQRRGLEADPARMRELAQEKNATNDEDACE